MDKKPEKLVPEVRFKGFTDDWEQRKLGEIAERILRKNSDLQSLLPLTISAQDGLVDQTIYFNKQVASKQLKNYLLLYNGDFAYNKSYSVGYPYGAIKRLDKYKQGVLSTLYIAFKPTNINSDFLQHYYDTDKWYREIYRNAAEGARNHGLLNISANDFFNSKLITPSDNDEQLKIAKIINLFNRLITLQQRKLEQLKQLKKAMLQQLFVDKNSKQPILRFKSFSGDWEQHKLKDISIIIAGGDKNKDKLKKIGNYPVIANAVNSDGVVGYYDDSYRIEAPAITVTGRGDIGHATPRYLNFTPVVRLLALKTKHDVLFLANAINKITIFNESTGVPQLTKPQLSKYSVKVTKLNEEKKISKIINTLNKLVTLQQNNLTQLTTLKKYLLQNLFV